MCKYLTDKKYINRSMNASDLFYVSLFLISINNFKLFQSVNPYLQGQRLDNVVAKKSVPQFSDEDKGPE